MKRALLVIATLAASAALVASAQQSSPASKATPPAKSASGQGKDAFKGKLKPGLYEMIVETDMTGMPGVPNDKAENTEKRQKCITQAEIDKGIEDDPNCPATSYSASGNTINIASTCKDGARLDMKMVMGSNGYTAEMKVNAKHEGKSFGSTHKMTTKYIGPCGAESKK